MHVQYFFETGYYKRKIYICILKLLLSTVFAVYCILVIIALLITHAELRPCTAVAQRVGVSRTEALACRKLLSSTT